ncbi:MAG TPA: hypothetical protein VEX18_21980 [Polyangiaceae bacterium]|nr:hypothetical protein [Polyangiaceae bacterium]
MACCAAALVVLAPSAATAESAPAPAGVDVARVVEIYVSGDAAALARVRVTARELLLRLDVEPRVKTIDEPARVADEPTPLVVAHLDLRNLDSPSIDIEDGQTRQELTRRSLVDVSSLETGVEALLHVLYLAVESRLQVGAVRAPAPEPAAKPTPPPAKPRLAARKERSRFAFDLGPLMRLSSLGGGRVVPGGGIMLEPRVDLGRAQAGMHVSGAVHGTSDLAFQQNVAEVRSIQLRAVPTIDWQLSRTVSGCLGLGGGVDSLLVDPGEMPNVGSVAHRESALDPVVTGLVGARFPIAGPAFLSALASLDLDLAPTSFVARRGGVAEPLLQLPRLRAAFTLAVSFTATGARRFMPIEIEQ